MYSAVKLSDMTSRSEKRGTTLLRGKFPRSLTKSLEKSLHISRIFTKFAYKLCIRVIRNYVFEHYKVTKNQRDAQLFKHNINQLFRRFSIPPTGFNNVNIINLLYILDFANIYTRGVTGVTGVTLGDCRERLPRLPLMFL